MRYLFVRSLKGLAGLLLLGLVSGAGVSAWLMFRYDIRLLSVRTGSMAPAIVVDDGLLTKPVRFDQLAVGEIVTYRTAAGDLITHRVTAIDRSAGRLTAQGDANPSADAPIEAARVVSQPFAVIPYGGWAVHQVRRPVIYLSVTYGLVLGAIGQELIRFSRVSRRPYRLPGY